MPKFLSNFNVIKFSVVTFCVKNIVSFCIKNLLHFAFKNCYIFGQQLLHFALMLHFAS